MKSIVKKKITLTPDGVAEILNKHFGYKGAHVYFKVGGHDREGDWRAEYPLEYRLDEVTITTEVEE